MNTTISSSLKNNDEFWLNNPQILIQPTRLPEFFPSEFMTRVEQLNAVVRFCFYLSILLILLKQNINYIYIFLTSLVMTFLIYQYDPKLKEYKTESEYFNVKSKRDILKKYVRPTYNNPFMNPSLLDYTENPNRESFNKKSFVNQNDLSLDIEQKFSYNLYQDVNDIFGKTNSQRQFYTTPITTIPNEQSNFANWLYNKPSCKENNGYQCMVNNPVFLDGQSPPVIY